MTTAHGDSSLVEKNKKIFNLKRKNKKDVLKKLNIKLSDRKERGSFLNLLKLKVQTTKENSSI